MNKIQDQTFGDKSKVYIDIKEIHVVEGVAILKDGSEYSLNHTTFGEGCFKK